MKKNKPKTINLPVKSLLKAMPASVLVNIQTIAEIMAFNASEDSTRRNWYKLLDEINLEMAERLYRFYNND